MTPGGEMTSKRTRRGVAGIGLALVVSGGGFVFTGLPAANALSSGGFPSIICTMGGSTTVTWGGMPARTTLRLSWQDATTSVGLVPFRIKRSGSFSTTTPSEVNATWSFVATASDKTGTVITDTVGCS